MANPALILQHRFATNPIKSNISKHWAIYSCKSCGGAISACSDSQKGKATAIYPTPKTIDDFIPSLAGEYLKQALDSLHAPAGCVMLCASAVNAMLKKKNYTEGSLYDRINKAKDDGLITEDMAKWAHEVRLDSNDPRHVDEKSPMPEVEGAKKCIDFSFALAEFLFVLPAKVQRGLESKKE